LAKQFGSQISLPKDPVAPLEAATKQYVDAIAGGGNLPIGAGALWYTSTPPTGWLICDGSAIPGQYTALIALIGANLPDLRQRFPVGVGVGGASPTLATSGGDWSHQHNQTGHAHSMSATGSGHTHVVPNVTSTGGHNHTIADTGSSGAHAHDNSATAATGGTGGQAYGGTTTQHRHVVPSAGSAHTHPIPDASTTQSGHNHTISDATTTGSGHDHGGETGTGTATSVPSNGPTSASNPPWLAVNFIIKAA
jgi:Phage Tail Collar Domain